MTIISSTQSSELGHDHADPACFHCGEPCRDLVESDGKAFCCMGCQSVYHLLNQNQLGKYYSLDAAPGARPGESGRRDRFAYLDDPAVQEQVLDFHDGTHAIVTFRIPTMHCVACIWLLENLYKLEPAVSRSQVNFPRKELLIHFDESMMSLRQLVGFLSGIGYEPKLSLESLEKSRAVHPNRSLYIKLGVAGFCFANIMLLSFPGYFGLTHAQNPGFMRAFTWLSVALSLPVLFYGANDYLAAAIVAVRRRVVTIDLPIAIGIVALYAHSLFEILSESGAGYLDSFTGLIFFLLLGRIFQQKTYDALSFDRDYTSYFPVNVMRMSADGSEQSIPLNRLEVGDRMVVRHHELVPADAVLESEAAEIDYSFVTGESDPALRTAGDLVYAGGRHLGEAGTYRTVNPVSRSHLTQLWNNPIFEKAESRDLASLTNRMSKKFTIVVIATATVATTWWLRTDPAMALRVFASVLIIACPCALALAAPFTLGTAMRLFERRRCFVKNAAVVEALARVDTIVFDKTGTLTADKHAQVEWHGELTDADRGMVKALTRHSTHPLSVRLTDTLGALPAPRATTFNELPGLGLEATVDGHRLRVGSAAWTEAPDDALSPHPTVHVAIDGLWRGCAVLRAALRPGLPELVGQLKQKSRLCLLSGDTDRQATELRDLFGEDVEFRFQQSPQDKLAFVRQLQDEGRRVLMIGDGLNDAGALRQSDVGIAVSDDLSAFSPACDAILAGDQLPMLTRILAFSSTAMRIIVASFVISFLYNVIGIGVAVQGLLEPWIAAVLMPISSITVVSFTVLATRMLGHRHGFVVLKS